VIINVIERAFIVICELIKIDKQVCHGAVKGFGDVLLDQLITKIADPLRICQRMMMCPRTVRKERVKEYAQEILKDKPETSIPTPTKKSTYRILQLSDPHVDLQYEAVMSFIMNNLNIYRELMLLVHNLYVVVQKTEFLQALKMELNSGELKVTVIFQWFFTFIKYESKRFLENI